MANKLPGPADFIRPLNMNGLEGRILHAPATHPSANRNMMVVYGHHALLERWWGLIENLRDFGDVTMPDLPGFGGMDSFRKIGRRPTIDNYADYLAAFVKLRYKNRRVTIVAISFGFVIATRMLQRYRRVTIVAISFGFVIATRMLQRYPELTKRVDLVVSVVGFMHRDDFLFTPMRQRLFCRATNFISKKPLAFLIRYGALNRFVISTIYVRLPAGKRRFVEMDPEEFALMMDFEVELWQCNDVSTHWATTSEFLDIDNCKISIDAPLWHVASKGDHYFDNDVVEQHMRVVYSSYHRSTMNTKAHTPSIIADKKGLSIMVPPALRKELKKSPGRK